MPQSRKPNVRTTRGVPKTCEPCRKLRVTCVCSGNNVYCDRCIREHGSRARDHCFHLPPHLRPPEESEPPALPPPAMLFQCFPCAAAEKYCQAMPGEACGRCLQRYHDAKRFCVPTPPMDAIKAELERLKKLEKIRNKAQDEEYQNLKKYMAAKVRDAGVADASQLSMPPPPNVPSHSAKYGKYRNIIPGRPPPPPPPPPPPSASTAKPTSKRTRRPQPGKPNFIPLVAPPNFNPQAPPPPPPLPPPLPPAGSSVYQPPRSSREASVAPSEFSVSNYFSYEQYAASRGGSPTPSMPPVFDPEYPGAGPYLDVDDNAGGGNIYDADDDDDSAFYSQPQAPLPQPQQANMQQRTPSPGLPVTPPAPAPAPQRGASPRPNVRKSAGARSSKSPAGATSSSSSKEKPKKKKSKK